MYLTRSEYDRGVNTFSPEGRLFQVSCRFKLGYLATIRVFFLSCQYSDVASLFF